MFTLPSRHSVSKFVASLLYINSFLSSASAALLIAYCIDALLLRVLGWTVLLPLLPRGDTSLINNLLQFFKNIGDVFSFTVWPLRAAVLLLWRLTHSFAADPAAAATAAAAAAAAGTPEDWDFIPNFKPFLFVSSPQQLEEIFSGVCTATCPDPAAAATTTTATAAAAAAAADCVPCLNYVGVSLGYLLTAAAGLRLAASDLEDTMALQFVSFFAVVAAACNVCFAAVFGKTGTGWGSSSYTSAAGDAAAIAAGDTAAAAAAAVGPPPPAAAAATGTGAILPVGGPFTAATGFTGAPGGGGGTAAAVAAAAAAAAARGGEAGVLLPLLQRVFDGFAARTGIPCMVDAFGFSSSLPSWANEVKDNVPVRLCCCCCSCC